MRLQRARTHRVPPVPRPARHTAEPRSAMLRLTPREGRPPRLDSEHFRSAPRTCRPLRGRLSVRKTEHTGRKTEHIGPSVAGGHSWAGGRPMSHMRRRDFITLLGSAAAWPLAARAQQRERMRRIGALMNMAADDPTGQTRLLAFAQALAQAGWTDGRNVRIDIRWGAGDPERIRKYAAELVALAPDVILASGGTTLGPLRQVSRTVPTVFTGVGDPVGAGFVDSLARPGGNATGFIAYEWSISGKWLELLKEIAPGVTRAVVLRDSELGSGASQFAVIQAVAPSLRLEVNPINVGGTAEIERAVAAFARAPNGGLIATGGGRVRFHRDLIVKLAARHKLPAVYYDRVFVDSGGLISYGPDYVDLFRRAAGYVDRVLKGEKPADLPVQAPTKYETILNLKTAKALGLDIPPTVLARADEVIE